LFTNLTIDAATRKKKPSIRSPAQMGPP